MLIHDGIFKWKGFGGLFNLAAGECRLRIFDLSRKESKKVALMKPYLVVVSDLPDDSPKIKKVSVRSCCGHIASSVAREFNIKPHRMMFIEYYPQTVYGERRDHVIPEKYDLVEFNWKVDKAIEPKWRTLKPPLLDVIKELAEGGSPPERGNG